MANDVLKKLCKLIWPWKRLCPIIYLTWIKTLNLPNLGICMNHYTENYGYFIYNKDLLYYVCVYLSFDYERIWWRLFQKRIVALNSIFTFLLFGGLFQVLYRTTVNLWNLSKTITFKTILFVQVIFIKIADIGSNISKFWTKIQNTNVKWNSFLTMSHWIWFLGSSVFWLCCYGQFYWRRKLEYPEKTTDLPQVTEKLLSHNVETNLRNMGWNETHNFSGERQRLQR